MYTRKYKSYIHPLWDNRINELVFDIKRLLASDSLLLQSHPSTKELLILYQLAYKTIPTNPGHPKYRLGKALGKEFTHWLRAKFMQRRRLFFRYSSKHQAIIYVWPGNHNTLRKEGSKRDVYVIFRKMLLNGHPADDFNELLLESSPQTRTIIDDFMHQFITATKAPSVSSEKTTATEGGSPKGSVSKPPKSS